MPPLAAKPPLRRIMLRGDLKPVLSAVQGIQSQNSIRSQEDGTDSDRENCNKFNSKCVEPLPQTKPILQPLAPAQAFKLTVISIYTLKFSGFFDGKKLSSTHKLLNLRQIGAYICLHFSMVILPVWVPIWITHLVFVEHQICNGEEKLTAMDALVVELRKLINRRHCGATKSTPYSINALIFLAFGTGILSFNNSSDRPEEAIRVHYVVGFILITSATGIYGLILTLIELIYRETSPQITYTLVMEMQLIMSVCASVVCTIDMVVYKDIPAIVREANASPLGE
ncbi:hypothetical protein KI387_028586, partial [Taxus chinensis]